MNQIKRIKLLGFLFIGLALCTAAAYLIPLFKARSQALPELALQGGLAGLQELDFTYQSQHHELKPSKSGEEWIIDQKYPVKEQFLALLQTGFSRLKAKRELSKEFIPQADSVFAKGGVHISWANEEGKGTFSVVSNPNDPNSCYYRSSALGQTTYVAFVPGFTGDISNIFKLQPQEWRKKTIITGSDRTLQAIHVRYAAKPEESFILSFINGDYQVIDVVPVDSTKMYTYLAQYEQISVDKYLDLSTVDSIRQVNHADQIAELEVKMLDTEDSRTLDIYRLSKDPNFALVYIRPNKEWALMKTKRLFPLLVKKSYFVKK